MVAANKAIHSILFITFPQGSGNDSQTICAGRIVRHVSIGHNGVLMGLIPQLHPLTLGEPRHTNTAVSPVRLKASAKGEYVRRLAWGRTPAFPGNRL